MQELWARGRAFGLSIAVHILVAAIVVASTMDWKPFRPPTLTGLTIEAVIVDTAAIKKRREDARKEAQRAVQRKAEKDRRDKELKARKERQAREERAEKKRLKEQAAKKRDEDMRLQKMRERQLQDRKDREKKRQDELDRLRKQREKATIESKREEERLKQLETRRQAEDDAQRQAINEADLKRQMAEEVRAGERATLAQQYELAIQAQVTNNWLRPPTARAGLRCTLRIVQIPGGEVIATSIAGACNGDVATRRSLVSAVERAGSLPYRGFEKVFDREIDFLFKYDGD